MKEKSRRMALCGVMAALGVVIMLLGGVIPLSTFCCPALAGLVLLPVIAECGRRMALGVYAVIAVLGVLMGPDKESALLFAFLGYYPVLKVRLDGMKHRPLRLLAKLAVFNLAAGAALLAVAYLLGMDAVLAEYQELGRIGAIAFAVLANVTMLLYDRLLPIAQMVYLKKLRPRLTHGA